MQRDALSGVAAENLKPVVGVIRPAPADRSLTVRLTGAVRLEEKATVVSEVTGRVAWVSPNFSNGGSVAANEPLVRIDPAEFELEVEVAEQRVKAAQARLWIEQARGRGGRTEVLHRAPGIPGPRSGSQGAVDRKGGVRSCTRAGHAEARKASTRPHQHLRSVYSVWMVEDGVLKSFAPQTLGHTGDGWVVEVFDAGDGVVVGTLPGAREGLAVEAKDAAASE